MSLDTTGILNALESHALASGLFERVGGHEPANPPGNGLTAAVWVDRIFPHARRSGLAATSAVLVCQVRLYTSMLTEPRDAIDPNLVAATDALMGAYSGDFDLGGTVAEVDLLGHSGFGLSAQAGYLDMDGHVYRVMTLTVPLVCNDVWTQAP